MNARLRVAAICLLLLALAGLVLLVVRPSLNPAHVRPLPLIALGWIVFLTAAFLLRKVSVRLAVALILLGGIGIQIAAVSAPPRQSDDLYRYVWDGRVQAAGIDPYAYVPAAAQLDSVAGFVPVASRGRPLPVCLHLLARTLRRTWCRGAR